MKKLVSFFTALCMVFVVFAISPLAKDSTISVSEVFTEPGEEFEVTVDITQCSFANLSLELAYDSNVMTLISVADNKSVGATYVGSQYINIDPYVLTWNSTENVDFSGTLATLKFKMSENSASGDYPITVSYYKGTNGKYTDNIDINYDENFDGLNLTYESGVAMIYTYPPTEQPTLKPSAYPYEIRSVALTTESGALLDEIPQDRDFIIDVDVIKTAERDERDYIFAAVYGEDGKLLSLDYMRAKLANETETGFYIPKQSEKIGSIKAYVWHEFNSLEPLAKSFELSR